MSRVAEYFSYLPSSGQPDPDILVLRSIQANNSGQLEESLQCAESAIQHLLPEQYLLRGLAYQQIGIATWLQGNLESSLQAMSEAAKNAENSNNKAAWAFAINAIVQIKLVSGNLNESERLTYLSAADPIIFTRAGTLLLCIRADIQREQGYLSEADATLEQAKKTLHSFDVQVVLNWLYTRARLCISQHNPGVVADIFAIYKDMFVSLPSSITLPILAEHAHASLLSGDRVTAWSWYRSLKFGDDTPITHITMCAYLLYVRLTLAEGDEKTALDRLQRMIQTARTSGWNGLLLSCLILLALAEHQYQRQSFAYQALREALVLGATENYVCAFTDEGPNLMHMIANMPTSGLSASCLAYRDHLLRFTSLSPEPSDHSNPLIAPLSTREKEVLRLVAGGASNQEIADVLVVTSGTVKKHLNNIFSKLGVDSRTRAIDRARSLNLID
jgi:LuxR family maltose regulon positive regulatory protein